MFKAESVMTKEVITVKGGTPIYEAVALLVKHGISGLPVVDNDYKLIGILSEKDALKLLHNTPETGLSVADFMTRKAIAFLPDDSLIDICNCLIQNPFRRVPIVEKNGKLVGVISRRDIMKQILKIKQVDIYNTSGDIDGELA
jgi:CBS domain-containing protein